MTRPPFWAPAHGGWKRRQTLCHDCRTQLRDPGKSRCENCAIKHREREAARVARVKSARGCRKCGPDGYVEPGRVYCSRCAAYYARRWRVNKKRRQKDASANPLPG